MLTNNSDYYQLHGQLVMKTCNLSTVENTPSEARRDTPTVMYYYIDFLHDTLDIDVLYWETLSGAIETIWNVLSDADLDCLNGQSICAYMSDGTMIPVLFMRVDRECRELRISRVQ